MKYVHWIEYNDYWSLCPLDETGIVACIWKIDYYSHLYIPAAPKSIFTLTRNAKSIEEGKKIIEEEVNKLGYELLPKKLEILL
jgi:hypothetical protein